MDSDFVNKYNMFLNRLKQIEPFDGNDATQLPKFLNKIEPLISTLNSFDPYYREKLFMHIKNKCTDRARELVIVRSGGNKVESWHKLKELLLHNYAEKEASYTLIHKIRTSVLDSTIEQYYQKISKLKQRLLNRKLTHNDTLYSLEDIERITLQVFRDHLPEPTHSMILRRNAKSMEEAYRYIVEVQQQFYTQSGPLAEEEGATYSTSRKNIFGVQRSMSTSGAALGIKSEKSAGKTQYGGYNNDYRTADKYDTKSLKSNYYKSNSYSGGSGIGGAGVSSTSNSSSSYNTSSTQKQNTNSYKTNSSASSNKFGSKMQPDKKSFEMKSAWRK